MLRAFICENDQPRRLGPDIDDTALAHAIWIDLESPSPEEVERVERATGLAVPTEAALSEIESSSRLATRGGALYLSMPLISMTNGPRGVSLGFVLQEQRLITVRFAPSRIFDQYADQMPRGDSAQSAGAHVFVGLLEAIVDRQADALEQVRADLDTISHRIFKLGAEDGSGRKREDAILRATLGQLGHIGEMISHIRDTEVGAARIVPYVRALTAKWLPKELGPRLKTLQQDIASISDFSTHLNDKLQFLLDATLGFINIAQNNVMKVMTIASVVGIPPVLVAGIYGMNFKGIPEYDWAWGYPYSLGVIVLTVIIPLLIFRWRKWI